MTIDELLADHEGGHSDLQMDSFITIRSGGTPYGCYKQALRELAKRYRGVLGLYAEREQLLMDLEEQKQQSDAWDADDKTRDRPTNRRHKIALANATRRRFELDKSIEDTLREFGRFYAQAVALKQAVGELTPERRATLDQEMWVHRLKSQAATDYLSMGRIGGSTLELIRSLPTAVRQPLLAEVLPDDETVKRNLIDWWMGYDPGIPAVEPLPLPEVRRLIEARP